jgi:hypothetical protein
VAVWTDGDGGEHTGDRLTVRPTTPGVLTVGLRATSADGIEHRERRTFTVTRP